MKCMKPSSMFLHQMQDKSNAQTFFSNNETINPSENNGVMLIDVDAALLLTSLSSLCERELHQDHKKSSFPQLGSVSENKHQELSSQPKQGGSSLDDYCDSSSENDCLSNEDDFPMSSHVRNGSSRIRTVSLDCSGNVCAYPPFENLSAYINNNKKTSLANISSDSPKPSGTISVSPTCSPKVRCHRKQSRQKFKSENKGSLCLRKRICQRRQEEQRNNKQQDGKSSLSKMFVPLTPCDVDKSDIKCVDSLQLPKLSLSPLSPEKTSMNNQPSDKSQSIKTILRRKFSWKNYPELEAFLIANREEYLRHSALNYTVQQKKYNNCLTERLVQLATSYGYVFDREAFSFVTIRDRIRCYYKSYVQSSKKRGLIIGYAARRAGLMTDDELEKSASIAGHIVIPDL